MPPPEHAHHQNDDGDQRRHDDALHKKFAHAASEREAAIKISAREVVWFSELTIGKLAIGELRIIQLPRDTTPISKSRRR